MSGHRSRRSAEFNSGVLACVFISPLWPGRDEVSRIIVLHWDLALDLHRLIEMRRGNRRTVEPASSYERILVPRGGLPMEESNVKKCRVEASLLCGIAADVWWVDLVAPIERMGE